MDIGQGHAMDTRKRTKIEKNSVTDRFDFIQWATDITCDGWKRVQRNKSVQTLGRVSTTCHYVAEFFFPLDAIHGTNT